MNFPFFISRRYLFSKKSTHVINIISFISMTGIAVATMALVIVLSVFNGFRDLVASFFTNFDPQIEVVPAKGKSAPADAPALDKIRRLPFVDVATNCVEDQALAVYQDKQAMVVVKGVDDNFDRLTHIGDILQGDGEFSLHAANLEYGVLGARLAMNLGTGARWNGYLKVFAPQRQGQLDMMDPTSGFVVDSLISPGVVFQVKQSKYDSRYMLTSINFARRIFGMQGEITSLELRLKPGTDMTSARDEIQKICGDKFIAKDRYQQQEDTFKIMKVEKFIAYIFLTFILIVACFNIIGSLSMLIIDKREDVNTLRNLGANDRQITRIFLFEGRMISAIGAVIGIGVGLLLCWLQQTYGLVALGQSAGSFVVDAYPVSVHYADIAVIFVTVIAVSWLAVWYPVRYFSRRLLE